MFTEYFYPCLKFYFANLWNLIFQAAQHKEPKTSRLAYEFWQSLIEEETKRLIKNDGSSEGYIFAC